MAKKSSVAGKAAASKNPASRKKPAAAKKRTTATPWLPGPPPSISITGLSSYDHTTPITVTGFCTPAASQVSGCMTSATAQLGPQPPVAANPYFWSLPFPGGYAPSAGNYMLEVFLVNLPNVSCSATITLT